MSSTVRRAAVRRAAAVLVAVSALGLTACGPSEDGAAGAPTASATSGTSSATPDATATAAPTTDAPKPSAPKAPKPTAAPGTTKTAKPSTGPDYDVFPCSTFDVTFKAELAEPTTSSYLLKVTNKSGKACRALGHPIVTFGDLDGAAHQVGAAPGIEDALLLKPGQTAYAGLTGGAGGAGSKTVSFIKLTMDTESDLTQTPLKATTPGFHVSDKSSVTPWVDNAEDALSIG
ncbi:DUF4232 domain-containing protein [Streptomyces sp. NPDC004327]|uniref:DUF4232 domain-containing protein n=1 Tax=Streptomyces sp. NPDC004327 TaxID=3364699 RepID=UPI0036873623